MDANSKLPLISIRGLKHYFPVRNKKNLFVKANDGIDLDIYQGETFGLVGESGCGKSTLGRVLLQLYHQTQGRVLYYGRTLDELAPSYIEETLKALPKSMSILRGKGFNGQSPDINAELQKDGIYLNAVHVIGGLIVSDDIEEVSRICLLRHEASKSHVRCLERLRESQMKLEDGSSEANEKAVAKAEADVMKSSGAIDDAEKKVQELRAKWSESPGFAAHDKHLDQAVDLSQLKYNEMRKLRRDLQLIFQDPYSSLNPRMTVGQIISEGIKTHRLFSSNDEKQQDYIIKVMEDCGLSSYMIHRYPHQFSGGQRQRIGIARSVAVKPQFIVCDEAVSALDVSIQSQILNLLQDLKEKDNLTYLFISHDLSVIKHVSDRVGVMYLGNMVEMAESEDLFKNPIHPYTEALLSAIPTTDERRKESILLEGDIPSPINPPKGCKFHTRCRYCEEICKQETPEYLEFTPNHFVACHVRKRDYAQ
jgi:peptide/nickel transport system ATP-binding protein